MLRLKNTTRHPAQAVTFNLPHAYGCTGEKCNCTKKARTTIELNPQTGTKGARESAVLLPPSYTLKAGETSKPFPDAAIKAPEVAALLTKNHLTVLRSD